MVEKLQDQYRMLFEHSPDAMLIIDDGKFVDCNDAAVKMLGYSDRQALFSTHPSKLSPPIQPDGESSFDKANEMIGRALEQGAQRFEWIHRRRDGGDFPVEVLLTSIPAGERVLLHVVWRDISKRKRAEKRLQLARYVTESTSEGIIVTDMDPRIIEVNPAYCQMLGYTRDEVLGRKAGFSKSGRHDVAFYQGIWQSIQETGGWRGEIWDRKKSGEVFPIYLRINTIYDENGKASFYTGLFSDISKLKQTERQLEELAFSDPLTKLPNRALLHQRLKQDMKSCDRHGTRLALLFIDLDRFKNINDLLGHSSGDKLLIAVGERIKKVIRAVDTVARMGGDEFTVILSGLKDERIVAEITQKILASVHEPVFIDQHEIIPHLSIGISLYPDDGRQMDDLTRYADLAMYRAKDEGGDCFHFFHQQLDIQASRYLALESEMYAGLNQGQFIAYYQPIYELATGRLTGMEALVRWQHPTRGMIMPDDFIPLAEETGFITDLGQHILMQACQQVKQWMDTYSREFQLSVNLSARQFNSVDLVARIDQSLATSGLPGHCLTLEITESMVMGRMERALNQLDQLRDSGLNLAIDDFGTGYSSLSYLRQFPINTVKIDRSFVDDVLDNRNSRAIVRAIISMAQAMELGVIAEGVESTGQLAFLKSLNCQKVQGYLFSKPVPADTFVELIIADREAVCPSGTAEPAL